MIVNFKANGYLKDYIHDTEFILAIIENREMTINGAPLKFCDLEGINLESYQQKLLYYREVQKMLDLLGAKTDLDCNNLSDQDVRNIRNITNAIVHGKEMKFPGSTSNAIFWRFKIANLELLIWADKVSDNGYRLQSFFSDHQIVLFELSDKKMEKPYPITHYVLMKKNDFVHAANIDYGRIVADLSRTDTSPVVADRLVLFMLEMLKAYDEQEKKDEELKETQLELIHINKKSIGNIKNIKFEIIIINSNLENFTNEINIIEKLCSKSKYVIINTDINLQFEILNQDKTNIITYGLNQKADVTVSSITDANILIYLQKNILNRKNQIIEIGEKRIKISENERVMVYEILIIYIIYLINDNSIINKTQEKSNFFEQN